MTTPLPAPQPNVVAPLVSPLTYPAEGNTSWKALNDGNLTSAAKQADAAFYRATQTDYAPRHAMLDAYQFAAADRPIITLRYDDNSIDNLQISNALTALGMVGCFALIRNAVQTGNGQLQVSDLVKMQLQGHEMMCHSYYHDIGPNTVPGANYASDVTIEAQMYKEFITAAEELSAMNLWIQQWIQPGTWTNGTGQNMSAYPPFKGGTSYQSFYEGTEIGRLIRARFLGVAGYTNGGWGVQTGYRTRPTNRRYGMSTTYYDNKTVAQMQAYVEAAIAGDNHLNMFCHTGTFKLNGGSPTIGVYIAQFLPWLKAQVDAGRCYVMTESAALMATRGKPINILGDKAFASTIISGVEPGSLALKLDTTNSMKSVVGPTGSTDPVVSIAAGANINSDFEYTSDVPFRSLRLQFWAKGDGGASSITVQTQCGGNSTSQSLTSYNNVAIAADTWTKFDCSFGTAPSNQWFKPIISVNSSAGNPALVTNPILNVT